MTYKCVDEIQYQPTLVGDDNCDTPVTVACKEIPREDDLTCNGKGTIKRMRAAKDCAGNSKGYLQLITIQDITVSRTHLLFAQSSASCIFLPILPIGSLFIFQSPELSGIPPVLTYQCVKKVPLLAAAKGNVIATDTCNKSVVITGSEEKTGTCDGDAEIKRTSTATDCAGNNVTAIQTITIRDNEVGIFPTNRYVVFCNAMLTLPQGHFTFTFLPTSFDSHRNQC